MSKQKKVKLVKKVRLSDLKVGDRVQVCLKQADIDKGDPGEITSCAIARRLDKMFPGEYVYVCGSDDITVGGFSFEGPGKVNKFIDAFDNWGGYPEDCSRPEPISFVMTVVGAPDAEDEDELDADDDENEEL